MGSNVVTVPAAVYTFSLPSLETILYLLDSDGDRFWLPSSSFISSSTYHSNPSVPPAHRVFLPPIFSFPRQASRPSPFENGLDGPSTRPSNRRHRRRNDTQSAPPSHHVPSMGLRVGGALISSEPQLPHGSTRRLRIPSLSGLVDYSRWTTRLFPNLMSDDLFNDHEATTKRCLLFGKNLI
jgi:hypothetical protein